MTLLLCSNLFLWFSICFVVFEQRVIRASHLAHAIVDRRLHELMTSPFSSLGVILNQIPDDILRRPEPTTPISNKTFYPVSRYLFSSHFPYGLNTGMALHLQSSPWCNRIKSSPRASRIATARSSCLKTIGLKIRFCGPKVTKQGGNASQGKPGAGPRVV